MFWNDPRLEVKKTFQWQGYIDFKDPNGTSLGLRTSPFLVSSWTKPQLTFDTAEIISKQENNITYAIKGQKWQPISVTIIDTMNKETNATANIFIWLKSNGYDADSLIDGEDSDAQNFFANLAKNTQIDLRLSSLDPSGKECETWRFKNASIANVDFGGTLDYSKSDLLQITIRFNYAAADYELINDILLPPLDARPAEEEVQTEGQP